MKKIQASPPNPQNFDLTQKARHNSGAILSPMTQDNQVFSIYQAHKKDRVLSPGGTNPACSRQLDEGPGIVKKGRGDSGCSPLL